MLTKEKFQVPPGVILQSCPQPTIPGVWSLVEAWHPPRMAPAHACTPHAIPGLLGCYSGHQHSPVLPGRVFSPTCDLPPLFPRTAEHPGQGGKPGRYMTRVCEAAVGYSESLALHIIFLIAQGPDLARNVPLRPLVVVGNA